MSEHNPFLVLVDQQAQSSTVKFSPTPEQQLIVDAFTRGEDLVITAGAGTGKTSTITLLADQLFAADPTARGVYIAFNKAIADEVGGKFRHGNVSATTIHSLAWRGAQTIPHIAALMHKLNARGGESARPLLKPSERGAAFGVPKNLALAASPGPAHPVNNPLLFNLTAYRACEEALNAIKRFCQSDAAQVEPVHVKVPQGVDDRIRDRYRDAIVETARKMWDTDICSPDGRLFFSHDHYLKLYSMANPDISAQLGLDGRRTVLFFDEAQDSRPCITKIVMAQRGKMQLVLCGDSAQSIYRFLGCRDAMKGFKSQSRVTATTLSKTFRFGAAIASVANQVLAQIDGADVRIVPDFSIPSEVQQATIDGYPCTQNGELVDAVICRSNSALIVNAVRLLSEGKRVHCVADTSMIENVARDYQALRSGGRPKTPALWGLNSISDVRQLLGAKSPLANLRETLSVDTDDVATVDTEIDDMMLSILATVDKLGPTAVLNAMRGLEPTEARADVVLSTIHKSKGRQWDRVFIDWNGASLTRTGRPSAVNDELMLLYVAATRARLTLVLKADMLFHGSIRLPSAGSVNPALEALRCHSDAQVREAADLVRVLHPLSPAFLVTDLVSEQLAEHELVKLVVFAASLVSSLTGAQGSKGRRGRGTGVSPWDEARHQRGELIMAVMGEIGLKVLRDVEELCTMGFPPELAVASLSLRNTTGDAERVAKWLGMSSAAQSAV